MVVKFFKKVVVKLKKVKILKKVVVVKLKKVKIFKKIVVKK